MHKSYYFINIFKVHPKYEYGIQLKIPIHKNFELELEHRQIQIV